MTKLQPQRLPILVRQSKTFELVLEGKTYEQIAKRLKVSEDTVARDLATIADEVQRIVKERHGEVLLVALANYQFVVDQAKAEYQRELAQEHQWWRGKLDYPTTQTETKTLALGSGSDSAPPSTDRDDDEIDVGVFADAINDLDQAKQPEHRDQSLPLEVKTKTGTVRPAWRSQRAQWLKSIIDSTREITELCGIKKLVVEHQGEVNGTFEITATVKQQADQELAAWREAQKTKLLSLQNVPPMSPTSPTNTA